MLDFSKGVRFGLGAGLLVGGFLSGNAMAEDGRAPRNTYVGAAYEAADSRCAIEPSDTGIAGYTVEGSLGVFKWLHLNGSYFDGETDGAVRDQNTEAITDGSADVSCYSVGAGLSWAFAEGADVILRGSYVDVEYDLGDVDGFKPELIARYRVTERTEIEFGMAYYNLDGDDTEEIDNTEIRGHLTYNLWPWLALRAGGSLFDNDSSIDVGVRAYFGGDLF